jgi:CPA1 family monovalent cation:H+ antiporter
LFNDGVGVVVFFALVSAAGLGVGAHAPQAALNLQALGTFLIREVVGGTALGLAVGLGLCVALRRVDAPPLELLMTLALVMATYAIAFPLGVSGPIAVVVAGLVIGHVGRQRAMSAKTREYVEEFWGAIDELLNVVLFVLLGLQVVAVPPALSSLVAAAFSVPIVLIARLVSVGLPVVMLSVGVRRVRGFVPVLTWAGLRGGLSVAMVLSLPAFPERRLLLACTSIVVVFSILVQGLSMRRMLEHYQLAAPARRTGRP